MTYDELPQHFDTTVTVWPQPGPGESRDTEAGLQPWGTLLVGRTRGQAIIDQGEYGLRLIDPAALRA